MSEHWPTAQIIVSEDPQELERLKRAFASEMLYNPDDSFAAARAVFGQDHGKALYAATHWVADEFVKSEQSRLLVENGALHYLPNKADVARQVITTAKEEKNTAQKLSAWRFYAELMGMMPQKSSGGESGGQTNLFLGARNVMVMPRASSDAEWQNAARTNQNRLLEQAAEDLRDAP